MKIEKQKLNNGWERLIFTFEVEVKPRWWEFWKREIPKQEFTGSTFIKKGEEQLFGMEFTRKTTVNRFNPKTQEWEINPKPE